MQEKVEKKQKGTQKNIKKSSKGITLIALVITIIVLLILAGVSIATLTGENGILTRANDAKDQTEIAEEKEAIRLAYAGALAEKRKNGDNGNVIAKELETEFIANGTNATATDGENGTIIVTFKEPPNRVYTIDSNGNITEVGTGEGEVTPPTTEKTIEDLKVGDRVNYIDKNNVTRECIVLYDSSSEYGVQIITKDVVEDRVTLGSSDFNESRESYNNALKILYDEAQKYLNTTYASSARCIGSKPDDPDWDATTDEEGNLIDEAGYYTKEMAMEQNTYLSYMEPYYGTFKNGSLNYDADLTQMESIENVDIKSASSTYWLANRTRSSDFSYFYVNYMNDGEVWAEYLFYISSYNGEVYERGRSNSHGFRPVFTLKSGIKITGGDGETTPYTLGL